MNLVSKEIKGKVNNIVLLKLFSSFIDRHDIHDKDGTVDCTGLGGPVECMPLWNFDFYDTSFIVNELNTAFLLNNGIDSKRKTEHWQHVCE